jgi:hypothetical protein
VKTKGVCFILAVPVFADPDQFAGARTKRITTDCFQYPDPGQFFRIRRWILRAAVETAASDENGTDILFRSPCCSFLPLRRALSPRSSRKPFSQTAIYSPFGRGGVSFSLSARFA